MSLIALMKMQKWASITLVNLAIVALLGLVMRCKMVFSIPAIDFKNILHAHSHFAFGGWITLALLSLMTYQILPGQFSTRPHYKWLLYGILICALGMLLSFPFQGYGFISILFSTFFIFVCYGFTYVFIRDVLKTALTQSVKILLIASVVYMALSSVGAFTLAYLLATKSGNFILYKDAVYTYLHLQYNGFFTLAVFAIMLHHIKAQNKHTIIFSRLLTAAVVPSMFMSYLWHYPDTIIQLIAIAGTVLIIISVLSLFIMMSTLRSSFFPLKRSTKQIATIAMIAFVLKLIFQALTIVPSLGPLVFSNRPVIIGFLHLVLLGFVSLYLIAHFIETGLLKEQGAVRLAIGIFLTGIILNEIILFVQGLGFMLMVSSALTNWLLLGAALCLFVGALLLAYSKWASGQNSLFVKYSIKFKSSLNYKTQ